MNSIKTYFSLSFFLVSFFSFSLKSQADVSNEELDKRLYKIEKALRSQNPLLPMDAKRIRFGGFLTSTHSALFNDTDDEGAFNSNRFEILLSADLNENLDFFTAFGIISESVLLEETTNSRTFGDKSDGTKNRVNSVPLIISRGIWTWSKHAKLTFGRFVAPFGIINIEHFPPGLYLETAPIALRPVPGGDVWANFLNGVDFHGEVDVSSNRLGYHLNLSSFSFLGPRNPVTGGDAPAGDSTESIFGGRLWWAGLSDKVTLGASFQSGLKKPGNLTYGLDFNIQSGRFHMKNEFTKADQGGVERDFIMIQPSYEFKDKFRLVYRYDYLMAADGDGDRTEHIIGLNWTPTSLLRLRVEYSFIDFENNIDINGEEPDYQRITTSAVLSF